MYLLFIDKYPPADHDLEIRDFCGSYATIEEAIAAWDSSEVSSYSNGAIVEFRGGNWNVALRTPGLCTMEVESEYSGWVTWPTEANC